MDRLTYFVSSVVLVASMMMISGSHAESANEFCRGIMVNFTEIEYIALGECVMEYAPAPKLADGVTESPAEIRVRIKQAKQHKCMEACLMTKKRMFSDDGVIDLEKYKEFIKEFPAETRPDLIKSLEKCAEPIMGKKLTVDNKECADFAPFIKCIDDDKSKICQRKE